MITTFLFSFMAALFFSFLFNVPKSSGPAAAFIAGIGYLVFYIFSEKLGSPLTGYFICTFIMAALNEIVARIMKMTTTIFITIGVIPLVPGLGLYRTMQFLVQNDYNSSLQTGAQTLLIAGTIAMAIAINTLIVKMLVYLFKKRKSTT